MNSGPYRIFVVAGEPSGDLLGAALLHAIKNVAPDVDIVGVGGPQMRQQGLRAIFPMEELSVMGIVEILPKIPGLLKRINQTVSAITEYAPDIVVTIDSPDFCFRVARKLGKGSIPIVHYVAPTVWAWRPGRAAKTARYFHHLLALLPFEPPYFESAGLPCTFVGHPIVAHEFTGDGHVFRAKYDIGTDRPIIGLLPGSRRGEVARHLPVFLDAVKVCQKLSGKPFHIVIPTVEATKARVREIVTGCSLSITIISEAADKDDAFASWDCALAASGTVVLELAKASVPAVIAYRVTPITAAIVRMLVKVPYVSLVNILEEREITPELLQDRCEADNLGRHIYALLQNHEARARQIEGYRSALAKLHPPAAPGTSAAATKVLEIISRGKSQAGERRGEEPSFSAGQGPGHGASRVASDVAPLPGQADRMSGNARRRKLKQDTKK